MGDSRFDSQPFLRQKEGQHFERKSMWHGPAGKKRPRDHQKVREEATEKATTPFHPFWRKRRMRKRWRPLARMGGSWTQVARRCRRTCSRQLISWEATHAKSRFVG